MPLSKDQLYRLPWSITDNPIGWLEITDICNLYCKGCYRQNLEGHKSLEQIKEEVDFLASVRNCDGISVAGGEPLVHPQIVDVIRYIRSKGLKAIMLTNGKAMTEQKMRDLRAAGLTGLTFHIDQMQERKKWEGKNERELMALRQSFVDMLRRVGGGLHMSFGCTVYNDNFDYLPDIVEWARANSDVVSGLVFITFRAVPEGDDVAYNVAGKEVEPDEVIYSSDKLDEIVLTSFDVWQKLHDHFGEWQSAGYLDGTADHESIKWLVTVNLLQHRRSVGFMGAKAMEMAQTKHHWRTGRYFAYQPRNQVSKALVALGALWDGGLRRAIGRFLTRRAWNPLNWFRKFNALSIGVVQAPDLLPNGECDMCDSCPDMTVYNGKLYRSCRLDEVRKFGDFMKAVPGKRATTVPTGGSSITTPTA